jgi:hypothetical protein
MPQVAEYPRLAHDWLKHESDPQLHRETVVIASGAGNLKTGTVLGRVTSSGKYKRHVNGASDGTETAVAILLSPADASSADAKAVAISGYAEIAPAELTWDASVDTNNKKNAALAQLATRFFRTRRLV